MAENSKPYMAFCTHQGAQYDFSVLPFGLKNTPATIQKMIQHVLVEYVRQFCMAYLDDLVIFSNDMVQHLELLNFVFERFRLHGLHCRLKKWHFAKKQVEYLGHVITDQENSVHPKHIAKLRTTQHRLLEKKYELSCWQPDG